MFTLNIEKPVLDQYSKRQMYADVYCRCCGRGIPNREYCQVVIQKGTTADGALIFLPINWDEVKGRDSVEWGGFVGSHCAKQLPKTHKVSQKKVAKAWAKNGCP